MVENKKTLIVCNESQFVNDCFRNEMSETFDGSICFMVVRQYPDGETPVSETKAFLKWIVAEASWQNCEKVACTLALEDGFLAVLQEYGSSYSPYFIYVRPVTRKRYDEERGEVRFESRGYQRIGQYYLP